MHHSVLRGCCVQWWVPWLPTLAKLRPHFPVTVLAHSPASLITDSPSFAPKLGSGISLTHWDPKGWRGFGGVWWKPSCQAVWEATCRSSTRSIEMFSLKIASSSSDCSFKFFFSWKKLPLENFWSVLNNALKPNCTNTVSAWTEGRKATRASSPSPVTCTPCCELPLEVILLGHIWGYLYVASALLFGVFLSHYQWHFSKCFQLKPGLLLDQNTGLHVRNSLLQPGKGNWKKICGINSRGHQLRKTCMCSWATNQP